MHLPLLQHGAAPRTKASGKDIKAKLVPSPGKIPRRRVTTVQGSMRNLSAPSCEPDAPAAPSSLRPAARSALQQAETLQLIFRFLDAPQLSRAGCVCLIWRTAAADERLWMWLYLESGLQKPSVMPGSWRKEFVRTQQLNYKWLRGHHSAAVCSGHREAINCLCASGSVIVTGSDDMDLRVWDLLENALEGSGARCVTRHVHTGHTGKVLCCCIVRGLLVSGSEDKSVRVWDLVSGKLLSTLQSHTHAVLCMASDDRQMVFTGGADSTVCMWLIERKESKLISTMQKHKQAVLCLTYSHAISSVIAGGRDHDIGVWKASQIRESSFGGQSLRMVSRGPQGLGFGEGDQGHGRRRVDPADVRMLVGHEGGVTCLESEGHMIASGSDDKSVRLWNAVSGACLRVLEPHGGPVSCIAIRGQMLLSGSFDGKVRLFDLLTARCLRVMSGHKNAVLCLAANQRVCATGANDRDVRIWDFHDDSPPPIPASVSSFKKNWGMPAARPMRLSMPDFRRCGTRKTPKLQGCQTSSEPALSDCLDDGSLEAKADTSKAADESMSRGLQVGAAGGLGACEGGALEVEEGRSWQDVFRRREGGAAVGGAASRARHRGVESRPMDLDGLSPLESDGADEYTDVMASSDDDNAFAPGSAGCIGSSFPCCYVMFFVGQPAETCPAIHDLTKAIAHLFVDPSIAVSLQKETRCIAWDRILQAIA